MLRVEEGWATLAFFKGILVFSSACSVRGVILDGGVLRFVE